MIKQVLHPKILSKAALLFFYTASRVCAAPSPAETGPDKAIHILQTCDDRPALIAEWYTNCYSDIQCDSGATCYTNCYGNCNTFCQDCVCACVDPIP